MPTTNARIRALGERALALANNDIARAVRILSELTGLSFELAFEAIEEAAAINTADPNIINVDALFPDVPAQTWRWAQATE